MTEDNASHVEEKPRNKNLDAQKSTEAPVEEAKVSQECAKKEVEHLDRDPAEEKASEKTDLGAAEE